MKTVIKDLVVVSVVLCATACTNEEPAPVSDAARALGISEFEISEEPGHLEIAAIDGGGDRVAMLRLDVGHITLTVDERVPREVQGRKLVVEVLGSAATHESEGFGVVQLPLRRRELAMQAFLLDPQVAVPLGLRGVTFDQTEVSIPDGVDLRERDYTWYSYNAYPNIRWGSCSHSGCAATYTTSCSSWVTGQTNDDEDEYRCCSGGGAAERSCVGWTSGNSTRCGLTGPNGCAVCWNVTGTSGCMASEVWMNGDEGWLWTSRIEYEK